MRQADGSDLLGANDPRSASIGIIYVAPGDDRPSVLEAILMQDKLGRKQVAVVLPDKSRAFQRPVDFDGLKNLRRGLKSEIIFVAPGGPGPADFARQRRFTVYTSLDNYTSALRAEQPDEGNAKKGLPLFNRRPRLVPNANPPAPLESFDEPAPPPPQPVVAPVIPLSAPAPFAAVPFDDDEVNTEDKPLPVEPDGSTNHSSATEANTDPYDDLVRSSPVEEQSTVPFVAPVVPVSEDEEIEPPRPRSKSGPIPIPIALPLSGAATKPLNPGAQGANGAASPARSSNTGKQAAIGAAAVGAGAVAAFAATSPPPVAGGGQPPIRGNASGSGGGGGGGGRPRRGMTRRLLIVLLVLLTLLLLAGIVFASPPGQNLMSHITGSTLTATVTITPDHPTVSDSFVVTAVTGTPNPAAQQVQARIISYTSPSQSASANATGSIPGANATGTLRFINIGNFSVRVSGGILTGGDGVQVSYGTVVVPVGSIDVTGTAVNPGARGNIGAFDISGSCCGNNNIIVKDPFGFSGGRDPVPNSVITQNDINTASNNLITTLKPSAQAALQQKIQPNEQAVNGSLNCTSNVTANHRVGDQAKSVTVTGTATCTEEVYDQKGALALAANALKAEAAKNPGASYALVGNVVTSITSATVINKQGTVSLVILAQGIWVYQFTSTILNNIKNKIAKEPESTAQSDLNGTTGVKSATISISSGNTMPDAANITINVVQIPGLSGSPTPTPSTTPSGTTPTSAPGLTPTNGLGNGATVTPTANLGGS
jgi:hypothetical protein